RSFNDRKEIVPNTVPHLSLGASVSEPLFGFTSLSLAAAEASGLSQLRTSVVSLFLDGARAASRHELWSAPSSLTPETCRLGHDRHVKATAAEWTSHICPPVVQDAANGIS